MTTTLDLCCEAYRLNLLCGVEERLGCAGYERVAGADEAGRGALAGPVVAAAVIPDLEHPIAGVDDSKQIPPERRRALAERVRETARAWSVVAIGPEIIDRSNILEATRIATRRAVEALSPAADCLVSDALKLPDLGIPCLPLVKADALVYAVACASLLAKTERDRLLDDLAGDYPWYGFEEHKGYGAPGHRAALERFGPSPVHRLTFRTVLPRVARRAA